MVVDGMCDIVMILMMKVVVVMHRHPYHFPHPTLHS